MSEIFKIACHDPQALADRITKAPLRVITDIDELRAFGYQEEGAIVPELDKSEPLTLSELSAIAVPYDTLDAIRLVRVPQRIGAFMHELGRSGKDYDGALGDVTSATQMSFKEAPPGLATTTIDPAVGKYTGLHIDTLKPGAQPSQHMMGIVCGTGGRGVTISPDVTIDCIPHDLRYAQTPEGRLRRREIVRSQAAQLQGTMACNTIWLQGSSPTADTYEAYANLQPSTFLHDGTTHNSSQPGALQMLFTHCVLPVSFDSIV